MPISVTCQCGARLEIDEKFLGKEILCPDCQRPLPTTVATTAPPLDLPDNRRTSGLAVLSLALALVGAFTVVGTIAAIVVGVFALREIAGKSKKIDGLNFARAGIALGAVFTVITLAALISPTVFGLDAFLREFALAGRVQYPPGKTIESNNGNRQNIILKRPSDLWASYISPTNVGNKTEIDDLIMVNVVEDAYIAYQHEFLNGDDLAAEARQKIVLDRFYKSELVNLMGRLKANTLPPEGTVVETKLTPAGDMQELILDMRLAGIERRFLIHYTAVNRDDMHILVGGARLGRFERLANDFRETFKNKEFK
jgi:hypothetical protein